MRLTCPPTFGECKQHSLNIERRRKKERRDSSKLGRQDMNELLLSTIPNGRATGQFLVVSSLDDLRICRVQDFHIRLIPGTGWIPSGRLVFTWYPVPVSGQAPAM